MGESRYTVGCTSTFFLSSVILSIIALVRHVTPVQTPPHPHTLYLVVSPFVLLLPLLFLLLGSSCSYARLGYCAPPWAGWSIRYECTDQSRALRLSVLGTAIFLSNFSFFGRKRRPKTLYMIWLPCLPLQPFFGLDCRRSGAWRRQESQVSMVELYCMLVRVLYRLRVERYWWIWRRSPGFWF